MREYELTVVYDLALSESGGADASVQHLTNAIEARGGRVLRVDHWGRRRMAYPINRALDADYLVSRVELEPANVNPLEAAFKIDERVYRHLIVRADELPPPPVPREPRRQPEAAAEPAAAPMAEQPAPAPAATSVVADETPAVTEQPATVAEAAAMGAAGESPEPVAGGAEDGTAPPSGTVAEPEA